VGDNKETFKVKSKEMNVSFLLNRARAGKKNLRVAFEESRESKSIIRSQEALNAFFDSDNYRGERGTGARMGKEDDESAGVEAP
jgi:hypothetical protein